MVIIPAGSFVMGSPESEDERQDHEGPLHQVTLSRPFAIGRRAVTFDEYDAFCAAKGVRKPGDEGWGRGRRPVINASWDDAAAYCQWLAEQTGQPYRLPTEAEWEYVCRAGTLTPFHFGDTISTDEANCNGKIRYGRGPAGQCRGKTVPVGSLPANPWGVCEMHGNVWEWCHDCFSVYSARPVIDPVGAATGGRRGYAAAAAPTRRSFYAPRAVSPTISAAPTIASAFG
jgi:formylglycine-generating enzyme required for sulfatase activity